MTTDSSSGAVAEAPKKTAYKTYKGKILFVVFLLI